MTDLLDALASASASIINDAGVVSNNSQCQITRIRAIARARSRKVSCVGVYLFIRLRLWLGLGLVVGLGLGLIIPTCREDFVLRVIWQCDIYGMTPALGDALFCARCNIYISRLCYDVSVRLSVRLSGAL